MMSKSKRISIGQRHSYIYSSRNKGVYLLKPDDTVIRYMTLPKMKKKELEEAIINEYLSYAIMADGTPYVNWKIISENKENVDILAIGVKKEHLDDIYQEIFNTEKVKIFAAVVLIGLVGELVKDLSEEENYGVVFVGNEQSDLIFYKNKEPIYGRNINVGLKDIFTDIGLSERDMTDFLSYIDEAIIRNFDTPVKVYIASLGIDDKEIVNAARKFSSYEILSFNELMSIAAEDTHESLLKAAWNLGVVGHPLYVFVPEAYKEWQKSGRRIFYISVLLMSILLFGIGSINLSYMKLEAQKMELITKKKQVLILKKQIEKLEPFAKKYETLKRNHELLSKLAFIENDPQRYYTYYRELGRIVSTHNGTLLSVSGDKDLLNLSVKFYKEQDMLTAISAFKKSPLFSRVVIYSTYKSKVDKSKEVVLSIGVSFK